MEMQLWTARSTLENTAQMAQAIFSITNLIGQPLRLSQEIEFAY